MASSRRPRPLSVVLATIATTLVLLAVTPSAASSDLPGPLIDVEFLDVWTNDDGSPNPGDVGDTGQLSPLYDAWDANPLSSSDPKGPGFAPLREEKDVAICTGRVSPSDPGIVEVSIGNGYPGYVCTFNTVIHNGTGLPITVAPAVVEADLGVAVQTGAVQPPATLPAGGQGEAVFSVGVLNAAPQSATLHALITITVAAESPGGGEGPGFEGAIAGPTGSLTITKVATPLGESDTTAFRFEGSLGAFRLHDGESAVFPASNAGAYTISEALSGSWGLTGVECTATVLSLDLDAASVTVRLREGEVAACTFTNVEEEEEETLGPTGSLTIEKEAAPADDTVFSFDGGVLGDFDLQDPSGPSRTFSELEAGAYTISESLPGPAGGWHFVEVECEALDWSASGPSVVVNLAEGEAARCTFRNAADLPYTGTPSWVVSALLIGLAALLLGLVVVIETRRKETS